jgi:hypothetical protein
MKELKQPHQPKRFGDFAKDHVPLDGAKLKIADILNKEILVTAMRVKPSKYKDSGGAAGKVMPSCLTLQFELAGERYVAFTGSGVLADQAQTYQNEIPFIATVKKIDKYYTFT